MLYGQTSPGGLVNQVGRMPETSSLQQVTRQRGHCQRDAMSITSRGALDKKAAGFCSLQRHQPYLGHAL